LALPHRALYQSALTHLQYNIHILAIDIMLFGIMLFIVMMFITMTFGIGTFYFIYHIQPSLLVVKKKEAFLKLDDVVG